MEKPLKQFDAFGLPEGKRAKDANRHSHLETMQRVRLEGVAQNREFMGPMCCIPPLDWAVLKVAVPELISPDPQIQRRAWDIFLKHPASDKYRAKERVRVNGIR